MVDRCRDLIRWTMLAEAMNASATTPSFSETAINTSPRGIRRLKIASGNFLLGVGTPLLANGVRHRHWQEDACLDEKQPTRMSHARPTFLLMACFAR